MGIFNRCLTRLYLPHAPVEGLAGSMLRCVSCKCWASSKGREAFRIDPGGSEGVVGQIPPAQPGATSNNRGSRKYIIFAGKPPVVSTTYEHTQRQWVGRFGVFVTPTCTEAMAIATQHVGRSVDLGSVGLDCTYANYSLECFKPGNSRKCRPAFP